MEPEQSGFHWQVNIYFQFYILILGSVEVPYGVQIAPLVPNQIFSSCTTNFETYFTSSSLHLIYIYAIALGSH